MKGQHQIRRAICWDQSIWRHIQKFTIRFVGDISIPKRLENDFGAGVIPFQRAWEKVVLLLACYPRGGQRGSLLSMGQLSLIYCSLQRLHTIVPVYMLFNVGRKFSNNLWSLGSVIVLLSSRWWWPLSLISSSPYYVFHTLTTLHFKFLKVWQVL